MVRAGIILYGLEPFYPFDEDDVLRLTPGNDAKKRYIACSYCSCRGIYYYGATYSPK